MFLIWYKSEKIFEIEMVLIYIICNYFYMYELDLDNLLFLFIIFFNEIFRYF